MADYYSIITNRGKELEAEALASGRLIVLTHFVVGDSNGKQVKPDPSQIRLINETYRGDIAELVVSSEQSTQLMAKIVLPTGVGGFTVREVGLMTDTGELYAVANCPSIDKPVGGVSVNMQFRLAVSDTSNITLNVATGDGLFLRIDQNLKEIKARGAEAQKTSRESIGVLDGTTQQRGLVQLNSNVNSTSEAQAATPAAVKIVMDNANARLAKDRNGADIPNVALFLQNLGLTETIKLAAGAVPSTRKINGHALAADTNVTAQDIFNAQTIGIDAGQNLNDFKTAGLYFQGMNVNTSSALNYPENNAGALIVLRSAGITQIYYVYNSSRIWSRSQYSNGVWTPWAREYNTQNKPSAADVGALPITGGTLNGSLGIGVANALGGNSIVLGDSDTGFKQEGDGILNVYANSALVMRFISSLIESLKPLKVNGNCIATGELQAANGAVRIATDGNLYGTKWGGWLDAWLKNNYQPKGNYTPAGQAYTKAESDARYLQDIRLGAQVLVSGSGNGGKASLTAPSGHMLTAILDGDTSRWPMPDSPDQAYARPIQKKLVNGNWITVEQL